MDLEGLHVVNPSHGERRVWLDMARKNAVLAIGQQVLRSNGWVRADSRSRGPVTVHTVMDRTLFRAGETLSMKHLARMPTASGFSIPDAARFPTAAEIEDAVVAMRNDLASVVA